MIHEIDITAKSPEEENAVGLNVEEGKNWSIKVYLDKLKVYKNANIVKLSKRINYIFLIELVCVMSQQEGIWNEDNWCNYDCPPTNVIRKMGFFPI